MSEKLKHDRIARNAAAILAGIYAADPNKTTAVGKLAMEQGDHGTTQTAVREAFAIEAEVERRLKGEA